MRIQKNIQWFQIFYLLLKMNGIYRNLHTFWDIRSPRNIYIRIKKESISRCKFFDSRYFWHYIFSDFSHHVYFCSWRFVFEVIWWGKISKGICMEKSYWNDTHIEFCAKMLFCLPKIIASLVPEWTLLLSIHKNWVKYYLLSWDLEDRYLLYHVWFLMGRIRI